jgi:hypothetical protein
MTSIRNVLSTERRQQILNEFFTWYDAIPLGSRAIELEKFEPSLTINKLTMWRYGRSFPQLEHLLGMKRRIGSERFSLTVSEQEICRQNGIQVPEELAALSQTRLKVEPTDRELGSDARGAVQNILDSMIGQITAIKKLVRGTALEPSFRQSGAKLVVSMINILGINAQDFEKVMEQGEPGDPKRLRQIIGLIGGAERR